MPAVEQPEKHMRWIPKKSGLEIWLDYHNHEMELIRTVVPFTVQYYKYVYLLRCCKIVLDFYVILWENIYHEIKRRNYERTI